MVTIPLYFFVSVDFIGRNENQGRFFIAEALEIFAVPRQRLTGLITGCNLSIMVLDDILRTT